MAHILMLAMMNHILLSLGIASVSQIPQALV
jgi:hypothetical protein